MHEFRENQNVRKNFLHNKQRIKPFILMNKRFITKHGNAIFELMLLGGIQLLFHHPQKSAHFVYIRFTEASVRVM